MKMKSISEGYTMIGNHLVYDPRLSTKAESAEKNKMGLSQCTVDSFNRFSPYQGTHTAVRLKGTNKTQTSADWQKEVMFRKYTIFRLTCLL